MKRLRTILTMIAMSFSIWHSAAQSLPTNIYSGPFKAGHIQGIALDKKNNHIYLSYTTMLVKCDLQGNILGSVTGLIGHLGDLSFNDEDGRVYGSLEYKNDAIGKGIIAQEKSNKTFLGTFYIAIFDGKKITRQGIDFQESDVATTVLLQQVCHDYSTTVHTSVGDFEHRLGCSGIDGVSFGPKFGKSSGKQLLTVAYGIYSDTNRTDNDYQVLLQYDVSQWHKYERRLTQTEDGMHTSGPATPDGIYYAYTGNTTYGVQNMEYDKELKVWWLAVYKGVKKEFPNYSLFAIDGASKPRQKPLKGVDYIKRGAVVELQQHLPQQNDPATGIGGWHFGLGSTGFYPVEGGYYYISHNYANREGQGSNLRLYRFSGDANSPFTLVE